VINTKERNRFLKFAVVGAIGALIDFGVMNLLTALTPMNLQWASTISFITAVISNFLWNRFWTFPESRQFSILPQLIQFSIVSVIGWAFRFMTINWFTDVFTSLVKPFIPANIILPFVTITPLFLGKNAALAILILIVMLWNFFVNRFWTYKKIQ
jgi:putative flippase GtrA